MAEAEKGKNRQRFTLFVNQMNALILRFWELQLGWEC